MYPSRPGFRTSLYEITSCLAELLIPRVMSTWLTRALWEQIWKFFLLVTQQKLEKEYETLSLLLFGVWIHIQQGNNGWGRRKAWNFYRFLYQININVSFLWFVLFLFLFACFGIYFLLLLTCQVCKTNVIFQITSCSSFPTFHYVPWMKCLLKLHSEFINYSALTGIVKYVVNFSQRLWKWSHIMSGFFP